MKWRKKNRAISLLLILLFTDIMQRGVIKVVNTIKRIENKALSLTLMDQSQYYKKQQRQEELSGHLVLTMRHHMELNC